MTCMNLITFNYNLIFLIFFEVLRNLHWHTEIYFENLIRKTLGGTKIVSLNPPRRLLTPVLLSLTLLGGVLYFWWQSSLSTSEVSFPSGGSRTALSDFSPALVLSCALPLPWRTSRPCTAGRVPAIAERYPDEKKRFEDFKEQQTNKQTKNVVNVGRLWCVW